ncbi:hypothetical protein CEXT_435751 [Caerostris extrusa]|uniref:Uncharacterized protein n=1 Tax=Caerostris extrusa TaxID=172846 RepID=A0AAV4Q8Z9_CAEEX|nr:hypothetical protein CEXT_435751 [Caerostris extrusa]
MLPKPTSPSPLLEHPFLKTKNSCFSQFLQPFNSGFVKNSRFKTATGRERQMMPPNENPAIPDASARSISSSRLPVNSLMDPTRTLGKSSALPLPPLPSIALQEVAGLSSDPDSSQSEWMGGSRSYRFSVFQQFY